MGGSASKVSEKTGLTPRDHKYLDFILQLNIFRRTQGGTTDPIQGLQDQLKRVLNRAKKLGNADWPDTEFQSTTTDLAGALERVDGFVTSVENEDPKRHTNKLYLADLKDLQSRLKAAVEQAAVRVAQATGRKVRRRRAEVASAGNPGRSQEPITIGPGGIVSQPPRAGPPGLRPGTRTWDFRTKW